MQRRALDLAIQAARALMYSHEKGLIHQDMKPGNLLLSAEWEARVADFGLEVSTVNTEQEYCFRSPKYVIKDYVRDLQICSHQ